MTSRFPPKKFYGYVTDIFL